MSDLNSYTFTGRLAADAELKYTASGTAVWNARVAVGYGYGDNKGTNWLRVQVFGKRAESLGKLELTKGTAVGIAGELRVREYETANGKGTSVEVSAQDVALLGGKRDGGAERPAKQREAAADDFADDSTIPF